MARHHAVMSGKEGVWSSLWKHGGRMWERVCLPLLCLLHLPLFLSGENVSTLVITTVVLIGAIYSGDISPQLFAVADFGPTILWNSFWKACIKYRWKYFKFLSSSFFFSGRYIIVRGNLALEFIILMFCWVVATFVISGEKWLRYATYFSITFPSVPVIQQNKMQTNVFPLLIISTDVKLQFSFHCIICIGLCSYIVLFIIYKIPNLTLLILQYYDLINYCLFIKLTNPLQLLFEPHGKPWRNVMFNALHVVNYNAWDVSYYSFFISIWYKIILFKSIWWTSKIKCNLKVII